MQQKEIWISIDAVEAFQRTVKSSDLFAYVIADNLWAKADETQQKEMCNSLDAVVTFQKAFQYDYYMISYMLLNKAMPEQWQVMLRNIDQEAFIHSWNMLNCNTLLYIASVLGYLALVRLRLDNVANINVINYSNM